MTPEIQPVVQFLANNYSTIFWVTGNVIAYCVIIYIITAHRFSTRIYAWILILVGIPWLGLVLFYLFGRDWRMLRKELEGRKKEIDTKLKIPIERIKAYDARYREKILDTSSDYTT